MTRLPVLAERIIDVNEGKTITLELTHLDKNKALIVPISLRYRIDDVTNNLTVLDYTAVATPGSTNTIVITAVQNKKSRQNQKRERRQVTTEAIDSTGAIDPQEFYYDLIQIFSREDQLP